MEQKKEMFGKPVKLFRFIHGGIQYIFEFKNGYEASVILNQFSYGNEEGLFEIAILKNGRTIAAYEVDESFGCDVFTHCNDTEVRETLDEIANLKEANNNEKD